MTAAVAAGGCRAMNRVVMVVAGAIMWIVAPSGGGSLDLFTPQLARVRPYVDPTHGSAGLVGTF